MTVDVSTIYLLDGRTDEPVQAELRDEIGQAQLDDWQTHWQPRLNEILRALTAKGILQHQRPQSAHWNWPRKMAQIQGLLEFRGFSVVARGLTQGLMQVDLNASAREPNQKGKALVYVDYLEVAPWNRSELGSAPELRGVGSALLTAAAELSLAEGLKGRFGLHSLPQANGFYRRIGMLDLGPDPKYQDLNYFEMTADLAHAFLEEE